VARSRSSLTLSEALVAGFARRRRELGKTQDEIARDLRLVGFDWTRATVAAYERGERGISREEEIGLLHAYETNLPTVLDGFGFLQITPAMRTQAEDVIRILAKGLFADDASVLEPGYDVEAGFDAEAKTAARFGVEPILVVRAAHRLWGRGLTDERERRIAERADPDASPRTLQAIRGHVTRELVAELAPKVTIKRRRKSAARKGRER
jgi:transcriptional regulator with XRE-family HTH domain